MNTVNDTIKSNNDTITKTCGFCGELFTAKSSRARYCSEACKQKVKRIKSLDRPAGNPKTDTDIEFDTKYPAYYKFSDTIRAEKCLICKKEFKTSLNLLRTCSVAHQEELLNALSGN
jgi:hypothetical protein